MPQGKHFSPKGSDRSSRNPAEALHFPEPSFSPPVDPTLPKEPVEQVPAFRPQAETPPAPVETGSIPAEKVPAETPVIPAPSRPDLSKLTIEVTPVEGDEQDAPRSGSKKRKEKKRSRKKIPLPVKILIVLLIIMLLLCGTVLALWLRGRQSVNAASKEPQFPSLPVSADASDTDVPLPVSESDTAIDADVCYKGRYYRYNDQITNILLIGIDRRPNDAKDKSHQADLLVLAAMDRAHDRITLINIPRDTMADIEIRDDSGQSLGTDTLQIALSYAYGQTEDECCDMCTEAVSSLFGGLTIHSYAAFYMDGISTLNDLLGGVTVTVIDNPNDVVFPDMPAGKEIRLNGDQAKSYIRSRRTDRVDASMMRLARQKQYMFAMIHQAKDILKDDIGQVLPLYRALEKYIHTDISISSISYLASKAINMDLPEDVVSLEGELILGDGNHAELHLIPESLYTAMLSVYYDEVFS